MPIPLLGTLTPIIAPPTEQPERPGLPSTPTRATEAPTSPTRPSSLPTMGTPPLRMLALVYPWV